jgi:hypothetical protein
MESLQASCQASLQKASGAKGAHMAVVGGSGLKPVRMAFKAEVGTT